MRQTLASLQAFRALAALGVVIGHAGKSAEAFSGPMPDGLEMLLERGFLGVDFFFVLSGFIIAHAHRDDPPGVPSLQRYALKRFIRIFPPYWPVGIGLLLAYAAFPHVSEGQRGELSVLSSVLLLPAFAPPALLVAWTLVHEVLFYAVFTVSFWSRALFVAVASLWTVAIVASLVAGSSFADPSPQLYLLSGINLEFVLGTLVALAYRRGWIRAPWLLLVGGGLIVLLAGARLDHVFGNLRLACGLGFALIVAGAAQLERSEAMRVPPALLLLGDASYALYLVHLPVISLLARVGRALGASWPAALVAAVVLSVLAGLAYHRLVEKPLLGILGSRLTLRRRTA